MVDVGEIAPESALERRIMADPQWQKGVRWGRPRRGHPEGSVLAHITEVLANVDRLADSPEQRARLRLIALMHDTFKAQVDRDRPKTGPNHHAAIARRFAESYIEDPGMLLVIEHHDVPYALWRRGRRTGDWAASTRWARKLIDALGDDVDLFLRFYRADNATGDKTDEDLRWFEGVVKG